MRRLAPLFLALALIAVPFAAHADPPDPVPDDDAGEVFDDGRAGDELVDLEPRFDLVDLEAFALPGELASAPALGDVLASLDELHPSTGASTGDGVDDDGDTFGDDGDSSTSSRTWRPMALGDSGGPLLVLQRWRVVDWSSGWPRTSTVWTLHDVGAPATA